MGIAYLRTLNPTGDYHLVEIISMGTGSPPQRPHPQPPLGIWGPTDPRPTHPIAGIPGLPGEGGGGPVDPGYSPPWATPGPGGGGPVDPGYSPPWATAPGGGEGGGHGTTALIIPLPPSSTPPPAGIPAGSSNVLIWMGPGTKPAQAWIAPYASTGPVTPPAPGTTPPPSGPTTPPPGGPVINPLQPKVY